MGGGEGGEQKSLRCFLGQSNPRYHTDNNNDNDDNDNDDNNMPWTMDHLNGSQRDVLSSFKRAGQRV